MIYQLESQRRFPSRVRIGLRAVGWVESEVQLWLASRIEHHRVGVSGERTGKSNAHVGVGPCA